MLLYVFDGVFKLDDCVCFGMWYSGDFKIEVKVREDRGGYCLVVVSIWDWGKKDVVGFGVEVCCGGFLCFGLFFVWFFSFLVIGNLGSFLMRFNGDELMCWVFYVGWLDGGGRGVYWGIWLWG